MSLSHIDLAGRVCGFFKRRSSRAISYSIAEKVLSDYTMLITFCMHALSELSEQAEFLPKFGSEELSNAMYAGASLPMGGTIGRIGSAISEQ